MMLDDRWSLCSIDCCCAVTTRKYEVQHLRLDIGQTDAG